MCMHHLAHFLLLVEGCNSFIAVKDNLQVITMSQAFPLIALVYTKISLV
jgi:hypothetical protein